MSKFDKIKKKVKNRNILTHFIYAFIFSIVSLLFLIMIYNLKHSFNSKIENINKIYNDNSKSLIYKIIELKKANDIYNSYLDSLPFGNPLDDINIRSMFGWRKDPFNKSIIKFHTGIDLAASIGDRVYSTAHGKVVYAKYHKTYGNCVIISHSLNYKTLYSHLEYICVDVNDYVDKHDTIGFAGETGRATGVHLHYEVLINNNRLNPIKFLNFIDLK